MGCVRLRGSLRSQLRQPVLIRTEGTLLKRASPFLFLFGKPIRMPPGVVVIWYVHLSPSFVKIPPMTFKKRSIDLTGWWGGVP